MNAISKSIWIADQVLDGLTSIGWVTTLITLLIVYFAWKERKTFHWKKQFFLLLPIATVVLIIFSGGLFAKRPGYQNIPFVIFAITILFSALCIYSMKGSRFLATSICSIIVWYGFWCAFISGMNIADDWV